MVIIELRDGLWMLKDDVGADTDMGGGTGTIRGYISQIDAPDGVRYVARLPALNPTRGPKLGEFWEWDKALEAILAERPRPIVIDPYRDLKYSDPASRAERLEQRRLRRKYAGRFSD
jgi:hypothetical protein